MVGNILLVEDDLSSATMTAEVIRNFITGCTLRIVPSGAEALLYLEQHSPMFVVLDYHLPDMNAEDVLRRYQAITERYREGRKFPPFIVLTGQNDVLTAVRMMRLGAQNYIAKDENFFEFLPLAVKSLVQTLDIEEQLRSVALQMLRLQASWAQYISEAIILLDITGSITDWNTAADHIYGWNAGEVIGQQLEVLLPTSFPNEVSHKVSLASVLAKERWQGILQQTTKSGDKIMIDSSFASLKNDLGERIGTIIVNRDITERVENERKLQEVERRLTLVMNNMSDIIVLHRLDGSYEWVSPSFTTQLGYTPEELSQASPYDYIHPDDMAIVYERMHQTALQGMKSDSIIYRFRLRDGDYRWYETVTHSVKTPEADSQAFILAVSRDVSEQVQAHKSLKRSEAQFRSIIDLSVIPYALNDQNNAITYLNPAFVKCFGYTLDDIPTLEEWWEKAYPDENYRQWARKTWRERLDTAKYEGTEMEALEVTICCKDGSQRIVLVSTSQLEQEFQGTYVVMFYDITERKLARTALEEMNQFLEQRVAERTADLSRVNLELTEIMGIAAHDLKNPLAGILTSAEILGMYYARNSDEDVRRFINNILLAGSDMLNIITNLLELNQIESGKMQLKLRPIDLSIIVEAVNTYHDRAVKKNIVLHQHYPTNPASIRVLADESALRQVLDNLVSNAVKYSPLGKSVYINIRNDDAAVIRIEVHDEGPGISDDDKKKLFGKFARLSAQPTGGENSTGLGLSIVKKMVEAMNGRVWCESEGGKGTTFIVELPAVNENV